VQVHLLSGQLWGLPSARLARVPVAISTEHSLMDNSIENRSLSGWLRRLYLGLNKLATITVAVSPATAMRLIRWGVAPTDITVIDNGIEVEALRFNADARSRLRAEVGVGTATALVGAVGRLESVKRFPQVLAAVAPTLAKDERELLIVGGGPLQDALLEQARDLGVADAVHIVGPRQDVPALLSAMDVLVSASRDETFGMAVVEAICAGLPVVYAECPALDDLGDIPMQASQIDVSDDDVEAASIRAGIDRALLNVSASDRTSIPIAIAEKYDAIQTTKRLDELQSRLAGVRNVHTHEIREHVDS